MESWARRSSKVRSSCENSPWEDPRDSTVSGLGRSSDIAIRLRRWHGLSAPAQDEGAATALDHAPVDLRPESHKVVDRRHQRNANHKPDRNTCDPVDGEYVVAIDRQFFPAMVKDHCDHGNDLHHHFELAQVAGLDSESLRCGNVTQTAHQKFASNHDKGKPC